MEETQITGTTSGSTSETNTTETRPNGWNEYQWRRNIREEAHYTFAESYIFDEYNDDSERYHFYFYDVDGEYGCYSLSAKEINRMVLFMRHSEAERKYLKHKREM